MAEYSGRAAPGYIRDRAALLFQCQDIVVNAASGFSGETAGDDRDR
jgi:hypothetical protein